MEFDDEQPRGIFIFRRESSRDFSRRRDFNFALVSFYSTVGLGLAIYMQTAGLNSFWAIFRVIKFYVRICLIWWRSNGPLTVGAKCHLTEDNARL